MFRRVISAFSRWYYDYKHRYQLATRIRGDRVELVRKDETIYGSFRFDEIVEIQTFKVDCGVHDSICLRFSTVDHDFTFSEDDPSFSKLAEIISKQYRGIPEGWYFKVMQPPFATNQRTLWKRDAVTGMPSCLHD